MAKKKKAYATRLTARDLCYSIPEIQDTVKSAVEIYKPDPAVVDTFLGKPFNYKFSYNVTPRPGELIPPKEISVIQAGGILQDFGQSVLSILDTFSSDRQRRALKGLLANAFDRAVKQLDPDNYAPRLMNAEENMNASLHTI